MRAPLRAEWGNNVAWVVEVGGEGVGVSMKKVWLQCHFIANNLCVSTFWSLRSKSRRLLKP